MDHKLAKDILRLAGRKVPEILLESSKSVSVAPAPLAKSMMHEMHALLQEGYGTPEPDSGQPTEDHDDQVENDFDEPAACPMCDGPGQYLGTMGYREHFRCRNCGADFHQPVPQGEIDEDSEPSESDDGPVEVHGVYGVKSKPFRRTFPSQAALEKWMDKNEGNFDIQGSRRLNGMTEAAEGDEEAIPAPKVKSKRASKPLSAMAQVKKLVADGLLPEHVSRTKDGNLVFREGYFYGITKSGDGFANRVSAALDKAGIRHEVVDKGNHYAPFRGGQSVKAGSHFYVVVKLLDDAAPAEPKVTEAEHTKITPRVNWKALLRQAQREQEDIQRSSIGAGSERPKFEAELRRINHRIEHLQRMVHKEGTSVRETAEPVTEVIKDTSFYNWYVYRAPGKITLTTTNGKRSFTIAKGVRFGIRTSHSGSLSRLINDLDGPTIVYTLTHDAADNLIANSAHQPVRISGKDRLHPPTKKRVGEGGSGIHLKPSHKGLLHKDLGVPEGKPIPAKTLNKAAHSSDPAEKKRAIFAQNAKKWHH